MNTPEIENKNYTLIYKKMINEVTIIYLRKNDVYVSGYTLSFRRI